jgi:serine/threonine protein kinase
MSPTHLCQDSPHEPVTNLFVLKSRRAEQTKYHDIEVAAYTTLLHSPGAVDISNNIPQFHGSWKQGNVSNILLEHVAGGTLRSFFENNEPPTTKIDLLKFWENLFQIVKPIARIHRLPDADYPDQYKQGYHDQSVQSSHLANTFRLHNDIKPDNILVSTQLGESRFDVMFKLADLGLTGFALANTSGGDVLQRDTHGTQMYSKWRPLLSSTAQLINPKAHQNIVVTKPMHLRYEA